MIRIYTIYKITNVINNKIYIGFTSNSIDVRFRHHINRIKNPKTALHFAMKKYGSNNFQIESIYQSLNRDHTKNIMEEYFIKEYQSYVDDGKGYNMSYGGDGVINPSKLTRYKQGSANRNKKRGHHSDLTKKLIGLANSKKNRTLAEKEHLRIINTGKKQSIESKLKRSKKWLLISPEGEKFQVINLNQFCQDKNLNRSTIVKNFKGWQCSIII